jgi:NADPH-dependent FMN reductase
VRWTISKAHRGLHPCEQQRQRSHTCNFREPSAGILRTVRSSELSHASLQTPWKYRFTENSRSFHPLIRISMETMRLRQSPGFELGCRCDAVLISSPEYAHGVPGVLKNALDWVVGSGELIDKPVALINASARATHAWTSLADTVSVMSARVVRDASITVSLDGRTLDSCAIVADALIATALKSAIWALAREARVF